MGRAMLVQVAKMNGGNEATVKNIIPKIAQIKVQSYYNSSSTAQSLLQSGDAWVTVWNSLRAGVLIERGLPIGYVEPKEGAIASVDYVSLVKGSPHKKEALMLINEFLSPMGLLGLAYDIPGAPPSMLLAPVIEAAYPQWKKRGPMTPDDIKKLYQPDWILFDKDLNSIIATWNRATNK
jgi:putative spermidine/putrescine transport system substrate-binding protein